MQFEAYLKSRADYVHQSLDNLLRSLPEICLHNVKPKLLEAMHYSLQNGGKRLRPLLVYAIGEAFGAPLEVLHAPAAAVELIHCYSLIHDDLPAMDDDHFRRGKPTCHRAFDEATAILTGDALQTLAFDLLSDPNQNPVSDAQKIKMIQQIAKAAGAAGMVGGQALDMAAEGYTLSLSDLSLLHQKKTGALIRVSIELGAIAAGCNNPDVLNSLGKYANHIGLAFQIQDDLLDVEGSLAVLGKNPGQDKAHSKATFPALLGLEATKQHALAIYQEGMNVLSSIFDLNKIHPPLQELSRLIVYRTH